jgi:hypothetical protein
MRSVVMRRQVKSRSTSQIERMPNARIARFGADQRSASPIAPITARLTSR